MTVHTNMMTNLFLHYSILTDPSLTTTYSYSILWDNILMQKSVFLIIRNSFAIQRIVYIGMKDYLQDIEKAKHCRL